jgi:4-alpha-glucanotransferase
VSPGSGGAVADALEVLGIRTLSLAIHDASFPMAPGEDLGRGSPYGDEAARLLAFAADLGFDALQLGPQGESSEADGSPYDATLFSRNPSSIAWAPVARGEPWPGLLDAEALAGLAGARDRSERRAADRDGSERVDLRRSFRLARRALEAARRRLHAGAFADAAELSGRLDAFARRHAAWLEPYALYEALGAERRAGAPSHPLDERLLAPSPGEEPAAAARCADLRARHAETIEGYVLGQLLVHEQHAAFRRRAAALGLEVFADLQIGPSACDRWAWPRAFLSGYWLGAPPSRTNPEGQPWGYPVLDPEGFALGPEGFPVDPEGFAVHPEGSVVDRTRVAGGGAPEPGRAAWLLDLRIAKLLAEYDGLRVDHPHGLVDPWVYRADDPDALHAVQHGARLFGSPDLPDHPALARFALVARADLDPDPHTPRWGDGWVKRLSPAQVDAYAARLDRLLIRARARGRSAGHVACEVLSTLPYPLARVLAREGLGRFRVTQKAALDDPRDVYRPENAEPEDWIMVGTHDTAPIWRVAAGWCADGSAGARAARVAERLAPDERSRCSLAAALARDPDALAQAHLAELFTTRARHVMVFFADLFGLREVYNAPGTISADNWSLRLPATWRRDYAARLAAGRAFDLPGALATALRARGADGARDRRGLLERLEAASTALRRSAG